MTDLTPKARRARENRALEKAGYFCVKDIWLPNNDAQCVLADAVFHYEDVERIKSEAVKPKGERK